MDMRNLLSLFEDDVEIERTADKAIANLRSYDSMVYTKLAQKVLRIEELESEIKQLKQEVKSDTRQYVADLFTAEDEVRTRVVNTISFIFTLSKNPKATETVQYAKVVAELENHLTPELIAMLNALKEQFKTVTQKEPSLKIVPQEESVTEGVLDSLKGYGQKLLAFVKSWGNNYDRRLRTLQAMV